MSVGQGRLEVKELMQYANTELDLSAITRFRFDSCAMVLLLDSNPSMVATTEHALVLNCPHKLEAHIVI
jgi:ABC-type transporter Mla MlaB component